MGEYFLVVNPERLLGFYRDPRRAASLAARFSSARVVAIPRDADREEVCRRVADRRSRDPERDPATLSGVGGNERIVRHVLGKIAMAVFRDPRAFGMTDWAFAKLHGQE